MQLQPIFFASKLLSVKNDREPLKSKCAGVWVFYSKMSNRLKNSVGDCCRALVFALIYRMVID